MKTPERDPRNEMLLALTAAILVDAVKKAEADSATNPEAAATWRWMKPYVEKIDTAVNSLDDILGVMNI